MSDRTPKLQQLLDALKKSENWFLFGAMLGVPVSQLKKIELDHQKDSDRCKLELLQYWLDNTLVPTWNEIVQALEKTDQLALAAQVKHDYLLSSAVSEEEGMSKLTPESSATSPATPPSSVPIATDGIKAEIEADVTVVSNLKELEASFGHMVVQVKCLLVRNKCDLSNALLFLDSFVGTEDFIGCDNFDKLMRQLQRDHIGVFNIFTLQQLVACFDNHGQTEVIEAYNEKKESFLKQTTVLEFQRAVVSRVEPILASGKAVVTITISREMASHRTLKDIEKLAMEGFEECHKKFILLHAEPGSIVISWVFPKELSDRLKQLALDNAAVLKNFEVVEVTVGGRRVFPCTQQEDMASSQGVSEKEEEKSKLKQLYTEFYQQLVDAVSDPDTCRSLTTQLYSTSLLSEEKKAVLSSSLASGSSYLKVLGVEEEPHLLTVLMEKMPAVKQLQTLSEDMSGWLSRSKQGAADTQFTEKQAFYEKIERQQLVADIERLTSDKADLRTRLQCYEEDLKTANELSRMREKAISGMMAHRRDTDVEEREERISHLKKELEELRREGVESGGRESLLTREVEDLKSKLVTKTDELNEAIKSNSELSSQLVFSKHELEELRRKGVERESLLTREVEDLKSQLMTKTDELNKAINRNSELSSQLKHELEELRRERERKSLLTREIEDLKSKLMTKTDELNKASKRNSELSSQLVSATHELEKLRRERIESGGRESLLTREVKDLKTKLTTKTDELNKAVKRNSELSFQTGDTTHQLKNKVDKINVLEAQLKNYEDTIADFYKESSQTELVVETGDVQVMADACALIAAIDFNTGVCSLAYMLSKDDEIAAVPLGFTYTPDSSHVPMAILLKKNPDGTVKVAKFGSPAQNEISKLRSEAMGNYLYFDCFKINLHHEAEVSRDMPIKSFDGKEYYLVEVIAFVLLHLKNQLMSHLSKSGHYDPSLHVFDFDWVITVPAIWKARGKQMMREAASLAGLTSNTQPEINSLTPYGSSIHCPEEENPHKLTLALEPECAALYCQQLTSDLIAPYSDNPGPLSAADSYMVCDLGANTVDITAYIKHGGDDIEVTILRTGNNCGGKEVNQQFYQFLEQIVNDDKFSSFCSSRMANQAILTTIVFHDFEKEKQHFGMDASALDQQCDEILRVELRHKFVHFYTQEKIVDGIKDSRVSFDKEMNTLEIEYSKVREFFEPVVNRAIGCITNALKHKEIDGRIKIIFLVGGFGACKYFCSALRKAIPSDIHIVVPKLYKLAVSIGAVLYRRNPTIIKARRMDASYGIGCSYPFDARVHDEAYAYRDPDTGVKKCRNVFSVFVKKGQKVRMTERFVKTVHQASVKAYIPFFTTTDLSVKYTKDRQGRYTVQKIGSLTLDCPNPDKLDRKNRDLEVAMDFSSTEIKVQARALYLPGQPPVKAVLDFL